MRATRSRIFSFGRAVPESVGSTPDPKEDGLLMVDETLGISAKIILDASEATLELQGSKATVQQGDMTVPVCPVFLVRNGSGDSVYELFDDGFVIHKGHTNTDPDALNSGHFSSTVLGNDSLYIGSAKISFDSTTNEIEMQRLRNQIPVYLVAQGFQNSDITPAGTAYNQITVHSWVAMARTFTGNSRLEVRDVFPSANADWRALTINTGRVVASSLQGPNGAPFKVLAVEQILINRQSMWLGDKLHISETGTRAQLQIRNDTIPVYRGSGRGTRGRHRARQDARQRDARGLDHPERGCRGLRRPWRDLPGSEPGGRL